MVSKLLSSVPVQRWLIRIAVNFFPPVVKFGKTAFVLGWKDVADVLSRDDDFRIAPINKSRIEAVSGPFFLGMDRCGDLFKQRKAAFSALARIDLASEAEQIRANAGELLDASPQKIDAVGGYARLVAADTAVRLFGVAGPSRTELMRVSRAVFHETFLNLRDQSEIQAAGRAAGQELQDWTKREISARKSAGMPGDDFLANLLRSEALSDQDVANIVNGFLIGAIDTTATAVANIVYEIMNDRTLRAKATEDLDDPGRMFGWCLEALRRRPHNPILVREASCATEISGVSVRKGDRVMAVTFAAQNDPSAFPDPAAMDPTRPRDRYMHFGFATHRCAGRDINSVQIPILVAELLRRNPKSIGSIEFDGPFPDKMPVNFRG